MTAERVHMFFKAMSQYAARIASIICFPTTVTFVIVLLMQVLFRYVLKRPLEWYLEVVSISYMWSLFMGITLAFKGGSHIQFQFLFNKLEGRIQRIIALACQFIALIFFLYMLIYGVKLFNFSKDYILPTLLISQRWKFLCVPIAGGILAVHTMELIIGNVMDMLAHSDMRRDFYRRT